MKKKAEALVVKLSEEISDLQIKLQSSEGYVLSCENMRDADILTGLHKKREFAYKMVTWLKEMDF